MSVRFVECLLWLISREICIFFEFQVIEDKDSIRDQCEQLGDHFISIQVSLTFPVHHKNKTKEGCK